MHATVVSIFPLPISEFKPGMIPDTYYLPASEDGKPVTLRVENGIDRRFVGGEFQVIDVPVYYDIIAQSIVEDYCGSALHATKDARPGMFWFEGDTYKSTAEIVKSDLYQETSAKQLAWFMRIVEHADDMWKDYGKHKTIMEIQRIAARALGMDRPWLQTVEDAKTIKCPACRTALQNDAIICGVCRCVVNPEKYKTLMFAMEVRNPGLIVPEMPNLSGVIK